MLTVKELRESLAQYGDDELVTILTAPPNYEIRISKPMNPQEEANTEAVSEVAPEATESPENASTGETVLADVSAAEAPTGSV